MCVGRHDLPENAIIDAKIFVTKTVADALDLPQGSVGKSASQSSGIRRTASDMV
jgi:hypothetical protein